MLRLQVGGYLLVGFCGLWGCFIFAIILGAIALMTRATFRACKLPPPQPDVSTVVAMLVSLGHDKKLAHAAATAAFFKVEVDGEAKLNEVFRAALAELSPKG